jgi:hypothetical protein
LSKLAEVGVLLTCIWEGPSSSLGHDINYHDGRFMVFRSLLRRIPGKYLLIGHNHFLPYPFAFIID